MHNDHGSVPEADGVSRRGFLKTGIAAGVASLIASVPEHRLAAAPALPQEIPQGELEEITITVLQEGRATGKYTARSIVEGYLERIEKIDRNGPRLNSVIELNPDVLAIADDLDVERHQHGARGPLHGIPVLIKDNIDTADKMATTAGSLALVGSRPPADAFLVRRLRQAGAIILGKTNLSEWANIRSSRSTSGWSGRGGADAESVCARPQHLRLEFRVRRGRCGEPVCRCCRDRDRRIDRESFIDQWPRGHQADGRAREPDRDHSDLAHAGHGGADGADRSRCDRVAGWTRGCG